MGPFCQHIIDAIIINFKRLFLYGRSSWGLSIPISIGLIFFEISILPLAFYYDLINRSKWKKLGWNLLNQDFIDMKWTPKYKAKTTDIPFGELELLPVANWRKKIDESIHRNNWSQADKEIKAIREGLSLSHRTFPLVHHFLESVHRCIALTVQWQNDAIKTSSSSNEDSRAFDSFLKHRRSLVWWQMVGFEGALLLDIMAWPLRKRGLPILEQDVPKIPVPTVN